MGTARTRFLVSIAVAATAATASVSATGSPAAAIEIPERGQVVRLTADFTADAAAEIARYAFAASGAETALLAREDLFADALAAGGAQGALTAPLLLTSSSELDVVAREALDELGTRRVIILGGTAAVHESVADQLRDAGREVERIAGVDRVETAALIAQQLFPTSSNPRPVLARATAGAADRGDRIDPTTGFADALASGVLAAQLDSPVLLSDTEELSADTRSYLGSVEPDARLAIVAGGTAAVSEGVAQQVRDMGWEVTRRAGADRFQTAVALSTFAGVSAADHATIVLLDGVDSRGWAPGFASAAIAVARSENGLTGAVLANGDALPQSTLDYLAGADDDEPPVLVCAPFVTQAACDAAAGALGYPTNAGR